MTTVTLTTHQIGRVLATLDAISDTHPTQELRAAVSRLQDAIIKQIHGDVDTLSITTSALDTCFLIVALTAIPADWSTFTLSTILVQLNKPFVRI